MRTCTKMDLASFCVALICIAVVCAIGHILNKKYGLTLVDVDGMIFHPAKTTWCDQSRLVPLANERVFYVNNPKTNASIACLMVLVENSKRTILFSSGNASCITRTLPWIRPLSSMCGCNIIVYDYGGYGCSTGVVSQQSILSDVEAVTQHVIKNCYVNPATLYFMGTSLGGAPSCHIAHLMSTKNKTSIAGVILLMTFTSPVGTVIPAWFTRFVPRFIAQNDLDNYRYIKEIDAGVKFLIVHGKDDSVIPFGNALCLKRVMDSKKMQSTLVAVEGMDHGASTIFQEDVINNAIKNFVL